MGCDIHMVGEVYEYGEWIPFRMPDQFTGRDYNFFTLLAGVRDTRIINSIDDPRGFPPDRSKITYNVFSKLDTGDVSTILGSPRGEHSLSFVTLPELIIANKRLAIECNNAEDKDDLIYLITKVSKLISFLSYYGNAESVRIIFNFDS